MEVAPPLTSLNMALGTKSRPSTSFPLSATKLNGGDNPNLFLASELLSGFFTAPFCLLLSNPL
jgi:hypothetical protein